MEPKNIIEEKKDENVVVKASELQGLMDRIAKLEKKDKPIKSNRVTEHTVQIREWKDNLVVSFDKVFEKFNPDTGKSDTKIILNVITPDKKSKKIEEDYLEFLNNATVCHAKVLKQVAEEKEVSQGTTYITPTDEVSAKEKGLPYGTNQVDLTVKFVEYTSSIEMIDGNFVGYTMEINNKFLNI